MSDTATTPPASGEASGTPDAGASGSSQGSDQGTSGADAFAQERESLQSRVRDEQGRADRLQNELAQLRASQSPPPVNAGSEGDTTTTPPLTEAGIAAVFARMQGLSTLASTLRTDETVKYADPSLFDRYAEFDSPEAFRAAVEQSHRSFEGRLTSLNVVPQSEVEARLKAYVDRYGELNTTPPDASGGTPTGDPSLEEIARMTQPELTALEERNPGVIDRVMFGANR